MEKDSRDLLLGAAKKIFARDGYDGATVKDLADEAGVNISLVSYYFQGKEGLFKACLEEFGRTRLAAAERMLKHPESAEDFRLRLTYFTDEVITRHVIDKEITTILHRDCATSNPVTRDIFKNVFMKIFDNLVQFMKAAQKKGILREDTDLQLSTLLWWGGIIHICRMDALQKEFFNRTIEDEKYRDQVVKQAVKNLLEGLSQPSV